MQKNKLSDAFIVKDPKTYVNAEEAWFDFSNKKKNSFLFIVIPKEDPNNTLQTFEEVIDHSKWEDVIWIKTYSNYRPSGYKNKMKQNTFFRWYVNLREYIYNFIDRVRIDRILADVDGFDKVFSGHKNTQEHVAAMLNPNEVYIMDSGLRIKKRVRDSGYIDYRYQFNNKPFKKVMHNLIGLKVFDREKTKFYTAYADTIETKHSINHNNYNYRRKLIEEKQIGDSVFFISSPVYMFKNAEVGDYINFIISITKKMNIEPSDLIYIPHPTREKDKDVNRIVSTVNCQVDNRRIPIESKITMHEKLPKICISPFSSALVNLAILVNNKIPIICAWHYELNYIKAITDWRKDTLEKTKSSIDIVEFQEDEVQTLLGLDKTKGNKLLYKDLYEFERKG